MAGRDLHLLVLGLAVMVSIHTIALLLFFSALRTQVQQQRTRRTSPESDTQLVERAVRQAEYRIDRLSDQAEAKMVAIITGTDLMSGPDQ